MPAEPVAQQWGWKVGRSIALELDVALSAFGGIVTNEELSGQAGELIAGVPEAWRAQWPDLVGTPHPWVSMLADVAVLAGVLDEEDYSRATLAMRELTLAGALAAMVQQAEPLGLRPDPALTPAEQLADLSLRSSRALNERLGMEPASEERLVRTATREITQMTRILRDGDLHTRFWLWLDQLYFEFYRPWRETRLPLMAAQEQRAIAALGGRQGAGAPPDLSWLPPQNVLIHRAAVSDVVRSGRMPLFFWTEPFGFFDYWRWEAVAVTVSYGEPSNAFESFRAEAGAIAERVKALSDPSRLLILRIIRDFAMDNTQMADYLGLARPTVSIHAKVLREAGLIDTRQEGRAAVHTLNAAEVRRLFRDLERFLRLPEE